MKKLGISVETACWFDENKPEESIKFIKECGFESIDYGMNALFKATFDQENLTSFFDQNMEQLYEYYKPLKNASEENGISISQVHGLFPIYYPEQKEKNLYVIEVLKKMMEVCQYLNSKIIVVHPWSNYALSKEEVKQINLDVYRQLIPAAKKYGVTICLENVYTLYVDSYHEGSCTDAEEACWYIDTLNAEAGEDIFGFCLDIGHANMFGKNIYQYIKTLGKRMTTLHIHDNAGTCDSHMIPYTQRVMKGMGSAIDWKGFLKGLKEIGYEGPISFETFRAIEQMPKELCGDVLKLIGAIGVYFRKELN